MTTNKGEGEARLAVGVADAGGTESRGAALGVAEMLHLLEHRVSDLLANDLRNAVADLHFEVALAEVEQEHFELAAVVGVNHSGADVDKVLDGETGARRDAAVVALGNGDPQAGSDQAAVPGRNDAVLGGAQIRTGGLLGPDVRRTSILADADVFDDRLVTLVNLEQIGFLRGTHRNVLRDNFW